MATRAKPFLELRQALERAGYDQKSLAPRIGRSQTYVSERFRGLRAWDLDDVYCIIALLHLPAESIPDLFPRNGGVHARKTA